jgi:hypothetical protein
LFATTVSRLRCCFPIPEDQCHAKNAGFPPYRAVLE